MKIDLTGQPFGRLVVIREYGRDKNGAVLWLCRCLGKNGNDCGKEVVATTGHLRSESVQSCGCLKRERLSERNTSHGCANEPWYPIYKAMMQRCGHWEGGEEYVLRNYRDRCIIVCEEWRNSPRAFSDWLLAHGWHKGLQIDRIDNNQGYSPENCRVATCKENSNNKRNTLRLDDGTPLAMFCSSIGIKTLEGRSPAPKYNRIQLMWSRSHKPHPELMQALKEDTDRQSRLLEMTKLKIRRAELLIAAYRELLTSKQTA